MDSENNITKIFSILDKFGDNLSIICNNQKENINCHIDNKLEITQEDKDNLEKIKKLLGDKYEKKLNKIKLFYENYKKDGKGYVKFKFSDGKTSVVSFKDFEKSKSQIGSGLFSKKSSKTKKSNSSSNSMVSGIASNFAKDLSSNLASNITNKFSPDAMSKNLIRNIRKPFGSLQSESNNSRDVISKNNLALNQQIITDIGELKNNLTEQISIPINQQLNSFNQFVSQSLANQTENKKMISKIIDNLSKISITTDNLSQKIERSEVDSKRVNDNIQDFLNKLDTTLDGLNLETTKILNINNKILNRLNNDETKSS
jgi:hypothetical protein